MNDVDKVIARVQWRFRNRIASELFGVPCPSYSDAEVDLFITRDRMSRIFREEQAKAEKKAKRNARRRELYAQRKCAK